MLVVDNSLPVPIEEALRRDRDIVIVSETMEQADIRFRELADKLQDAASKIAKRLIVLPNGRMIRFVTTSGVEQGYLRGLDRMIWAA